MSSSQIDLESGQSFGTIQKSHAFAGKVFSIVGAQLLFTTILTGICYKHNAFGGMTYDSLSALLWTSFVIEVICIFATYHFVAKKQIGVALFPFCIFTFFFSLLFAMWAQAQDAEIIVQTLVITSIVVFCAVGYVFVTKVNLHSYHGIAFMGLAILVIAGIIFMFFPPSNTINIVYSCLGIIVFTGYLMIDTSDVFHHYEEHEHLLAAMNIFIDIVNLMIKIAELLNACNSSD